MWPKKTYSVYHINSSAERVEIKIDLKVPNIQITATDSNGSNSLSFRKSFVICNFF